MVTVRNRCLGPVKGTRVSAFLDVEESSDNKKMLSLKMEDLNMYQILQESTCRHGKRRKVAARTLDALGYASGISGFLNDSGRLEQIRSKLQFAASIEDAKSIEKKKRSRTQ